MKINVTGNTPFGNVTNIVAESDEEQAALGQVWNVLRPVLHPTQLKYTGDLGDKGFKELHLMNGSTRGRW